MFSSAARALDVLNFTPLNNKPIRVMYSHRDPSIRKSGTGNIFIKVIFVKIFLCSVSSMSLLLVYIHLYIFFVMIYRIWTSLLTTKHYTIHSLHSETFFLARYLLMFLASPKAMVLYNLIMKNLLKVLLIS